MSSEFRMDYIWVFMPVINADPHLPDKRLSISHDVVTYGVLAREERRHSMGHTFLNVLRPAKILPPIQVLYFLSGGAKILILMSLTANRCTSWRSRSPNPLHSVDPPDSTMLANRDFRRSMSVLFMASTTIWCTPGYSRPIISGSKRISGARNRSTPIFT